MVQVQGCVRLTNTTLQIEATASGTVTINSDSNCIGSFTRITVTAPNGDLTAPSSETSCEPTHTEDRRSFSP